MIFLPSSLGRLLNLIYSSNDRWSWETLRSEHSRLWWVSMANWKTQQRLSQALWQQGYRLCHTYMRFLSNLTEKKGQTAKAASKKKRRCWAAHRLSRPTSKQLQRLYRWTHGANQVCTTQWIQQKLEIRRAEVQKPSNRWDKWYHLSKQIWCTAN